MALRKALLESNGNNSVLISQLLYTRTTATTNMPLLLVPPSDIMFEAIDRVSNMKTDQETFQKNFFDFCEFVIDSEELFRLMESAYTSITMVVWAKKMDSLGSHFSRWMSAYEDDRLGVKPPTDATEPEQSDQAPSTTNNEACEKRAPSSYDVVVVLQALKLLQCIRGIDYLRFPPTLMMHPDPIVRYHTVASSSTGSLLVEVNSAAMVEIRRVAVHGTEDAAGTPFPPLIELVHEFEAFVAGQSENEIPSELLSRIWWSRLRLQVICLYGHRLGRFYTQSAVEENPAFFTAELMSLCAYAPTIASSQHELICGILSDLFALFELGFLDFSLFPTPEVLQQNWKNVCSIFNPDFHATFRTHGLMAYGVLRGLQFAGGFLTRHDSVAIAKVKLDILINATVEDPVGRFAFTISQSMDEFLGSGLFETVVHLLHKFVRSLLTPPPNDEDHAAATARQFERQYLKFLRLNVIANIVEYIFSTASGHPSVSPLVFLAHRMGTNDTEQQELLPEMLQLYVRHPEYFAIVLRLISWCGTQNPRDVVHRLIEVDILDKLRAVFEVDSMKRLKAIKLDLDNGTPCEIVGELTLRMMTEGLAQHEDGQTYSSKQPDLYAKAILTDSSRYFRPLAKIVSQMGADARIAVIDAFLDAIATVEPRGNNIALLALIAGFADQSGLDGCWDKICEIPDRISIRLLPLIEESLQSTQDIHQLIDVVENHTFSKLFGSHYLPALTNLLNTLDPAVVRTALFVKPDAAYYVPLFRLLVVRFSKVAVKQAEPQLNAYWQVIVRIIEDPLNSEIAMAPLEEAFRNIRRHIGVFELDREEQIYQHLPQTEEYVTRWASSTFLTGIDALADFNQATGVKEESAIVRVTRTFLSNIGNNWSFGAICGGAFGTDFIVEVLKHPRLFESGVTWRIMSYAGRTLQQTARKISEITEKLKNQNESPSEISENTRKPKRGRHATLTTKPKRGAPHPSSGQDETPSTQMTDVERMQLSATVTKLENYFAQLLGAMEPFAGNQAITRDLEQFMSVFCSNFKMDSDPFQLATSICSLDGDSKSMYLSGLYQKYSVDDAINKNSIPAQSVARAMYESHPNFAVDLYRRQMDVMLPEVAAVMTEGSYEDAMTPDVLLRVYSITISFLLYHAWKEGEGEKEKSPTESSAERLSRLRKVAARHDELALAKLFAATTKRIAESQQPKTASGAASALVTDTIGMKALCGIVMDTITGLSPKLYATLDHDVWIEATRIARNCCSIRAMQVPPVDTLFSERVSLMHSHYRWTAHQVFRRLAHVPAASQHHLRISLCDFRERGGLTPDTQLGNSCHSFALDADVFFAEMKRSEVFLDLHAERCREALRAFIVKDLRLIRVPSNADRFVLRPFVVLVAPRTCDDLFTVEEATAVRETVHTFWPSDRGLENQPVHHSVLRALAAVPKHLWPSNLAVDSNSSDVARSFLPFAEELIDESFLYLDAILDVATGVILESSENSSEVSRAQDGEKFPKTKSFAETLSEYFDRFDALFRSVNSNFVSCYIQENNNHNSTLTRVLTIIRDHPRIFEGPSGMHSGTDTIVYLLRLWTSGPLQPRNLEPKLMLDALGNPIDEDDDDGDGEFYSESDDDDDEEEDLASAVAAIDAATASQSGSTVDETIVRIPETLCDAFTRPLLELIPDATESVEIANHVHAPPMQAAQPDVSPYHFYPPPVNIDDVDRSVFWDKLLDVETYVTTLAQFLTEHAKLRNESFINIASLATATSTLRLRIVTTLLNLLQHPVRSKLVQAPIVLNACLTLSAPMLTGMRRTFDSNNVLEIADENKVRAQTLLQILGALSNESSFFRQKIVSLLMRVVIQTHVGEADPIECTWGKELPADTCSIQFHEHELSYLSVGANDVACFVCRETTAFYHYCCTHCRQFACCLACKVRCCEPNATFSVLPNQKRTPIDRLIVVLLQASVPELDRLLESVLNLVAQPSFPCERSDGAMLFVDAILRAARNHVGAVELLVRRSLEMIVPDTETLLLRRRDRLEAMAKEQPHIASDDIALLAHLGKADFSHDEWRVACYLHHFIPIVVEHVMAQEDRQQFSNAALSLQKIIQQMIETVVLTMTVLSPVVARLKRRDLPFSSSPANVILFAVTARSIAAMGPEFHFDIPELENLGMARTNSTGSFTMARSETQALVADANEPSVIFKQVVPNFRERVQQAAVHYASQQLSSIAVRHRGLINFYLRNSESPYQILDAGLSSLLDVSQLDFTVRERLFRSRLEEQAIDKVDEVELTIQREQFLPSTLMAIAALRDALKKGIVDVKVRFDDEESVDEGGVTREWITLFFQELVKDGRALRRVGDCYEINPFSFQESKAQVRQVFESLGIVVGLALSLGVPIEPHFTRALYRHMIGCQPTLADLEFSDPELFRSLMAVNAMTSDDEFEGLCQYFTIVGDDDKEMELIPGGSHQQVSHANKKQYIKLLAEHVMTSRVHKRVRACLGGIAKWFPLTWLTAFSADEMELVCCGMSAIDVEDWRTHTRYEGFNASSLQVRWFWNLVEVMSAEDRARLLQFTRGSSKVPAAGFVALIPPFTISSTIEDDTRLPTSHTCYNQLEIPKYSSAEILRDKLLQALELGAVGFGFA